jgi:predicted nucleic acid-binding protein
MKLTDALSGVTKLGVDTAPLIYFIEQHPRYGPMVSPVFQLMADGELAGVTTVVTLVEVLTLPLQQGDQHLADQYKAALESSDNLAMASIDPATAERAAELRAGYSLRTPDALQIAATLNAGCEAFLTNDKRLARIRDLRILLLDDFEA